MASPLAPYGGPIDAGWRVRAETMQSADLPDGRVAISCPAPFGVGGLGRILQELTAAIERRGQQALCICEGDSAPDDKCRAPRLRALERAMVALMRPLHDWRMWAVSVGFDSAAARLLPPAEHLISFNGTSLAQFRAARKARWKSLSLLSANSHMRRVLRQHARAHRDYPVERPWPTRLLARNLREYAKAERVYVPSRYVWESFVEEGFPDQRLSFFPLTPHPRFTGPGVQPAGTTFDIVYVGGLTVHKGTPLLVDAIRRLPFADLRLVLVGGWKTRGMRRFLEAASAADPRIAVQPGDPLPHLRAARLCVHPAYEDGFAYAPAEALACGVPVIVSEDTGMKELIDSERSGLILPTGEVQPLAEAMMAAYRGEILSG